MRVRCKAQAGDEQSPECYQDCCLFFGIVVRKGLAVLRLLCPKSLHDTNPKP